MSFCRVTINADTALGGALVGVPFTATAALSHHDHDRTTGTMVVPHEVSGTASGGRLELMLWPNARGVAGSFYNVTITAAGQVYRMRATVPDLEAVDIAQIAAVHVLGHAGAGAQFPAGVLVFRAPGGGGGGNGGGSGNYYVTWRDYPAPDIDWAEGEEPSVPATPVSDLYVLTPRTYFTELTNPEPAARVRRACVVDADTGLVLSQDVTWDWSWMEYSPPSTGYEMYWKGEETQDSAGDLHVSVFEWVVEHFMQSVFSPSGCDTWEAILSATASVGGVVVGTVTLRVYATGYWLEGNTADHYACPIPGQSDYDYGYEYS